MEITLIKLAREYNTHPEKEDEIFEKLAFLPWAARALPAAARWAAPRAKKLWDTLKGAGRQYNDVVRGRMKFTDTKAGQWVTGTGQYGARQGKMRWKGRKRVRDEAPQGGLPGMGRNIVNRAKQDPLGTGMTAMMASSMLPTGTASSGNASDYLAAREHVANHMHLYKQASSEEDKKYHRMEALEALHFMGS